MCHYSYFTNEQPAASWDGGLQLDDHNSVWLECAIENTWMDEYVCKDLQEPQEGIGS